jgi:hypothetical protein
MASATACGGSSAGNGSSPGAQRASDVLEASVAKTKNAGGATFTYEMSIEAEEVSAQAEAGGAGAVDYAEERSEITMDMRELAELAQLDDPAGWYGEIVYARDVVFIEMPAITGDLPGRKSWLRFDVGALVDRAKYGIRVPTGFTAPDPHDMLTLVAAAGPDVETVGDEAVGRFAATHYRTNVEMTQLREEARREGVDQLVLYSERIEEFGVEDYTLDTWIDNDGRIRRLQVEYDDLTVGGETASLMYAFEVIEFDPDLEISLPPPRRVATIEEIAR